jgi:hypothetical protein
VEVVSARLSDFGVSVERGLPRDPQVAADNDRIVVELSARDARNRGLRILGVAGGLICAATILFMDAGIGDSMLLRAQLGFGIGVGVALVVQAVAGVLFPRASA